MPRSIEEEKEIGFAWFQSSKQIIFAQMISVFTTKKRIGNSIFGYFDTRERAYSEMPICEVINALSLPGTFEVNPRGRASHRLVGLDKDNTHYYGKTPGGLILCLTVGQFISPVLAHARPFNRLDLVRQALPESLRIDRDLGIAILIEQKDIIQEKLGIEYF